MMDTVMEKPMLMVLAMIMMVTVMMMIVLAMIIMVLAMMMLAIMIPAMMMMGVYVFVDLDTKDFFSVCYPRVTGNTGEISTDIIFLRSKIQQRICPPNGRQ